MEAPTSVRIDKWLWAIRIFKTRSLAMAACRSGHVKIAGHSVKPAREVHLNEIIEAKTGEITRTVKVLALLERRVGAQVVKDYAEDLTPESEYAKRKELVLEPMFYRPKGAGRPTKKERRSWEKLF